MSLSASIYSELSNESTITALVGTRIYPVIAPQSANFPLIVYEKISVDEGYSSSGPDGVFFSTYRFHIFSYTLSEAEAIKSALRNFLSDTVGTFGTNDLNHLRVEAESDEFEQETLLYHILIDFKFLVNS